MRLLLASAVVCVSLFLLYLVAINVFLSTSLFTKLVDAKADTVDIHYERAWSTLPGKIHARKVSIRGRDGSVEWIVRLDDADFRVSFWAFTKMRFAASHVRGKGVSFRLRNRLEAAPASQEEVADLPPIEGLPPYSIRPPSEPSPAEWSDADYNLWTCHLEDVVADETREVWINHTRFEGNVKVVGRFFFKPLRAVEVGPARVAVARGVVGTGQGAIVQALDGSVLDLTVARFDPRTATGADLLHSVSLRGETHAVFPDLARLPAFLPGGITARGKAELRRATLHIASGVLERDSHIEVTAPEIAIASDRHHATGALTLEADVVRAPGDPRDQLTFRAEAKRVEAFQSVEGIRSPSAFLRASRVDATGDARALDLASPLGDLHVVLELPEGELPNARALSRYIPESTPVALVGGRARATARLEAWLAEKRATGSGDIRAEDLDLRVAKMRVRGQTSARLQFSSYHFGTKHVDDVGLLMDVADGALASEAHPNLPLVRVNGLRVSARGHHIDLADPLRALDVAISMPTADVVASGLLHAYLPKGSDMQLLSGHSRFSLDAKLVVADRLARGKLDLESKRLVFVHRDLRLDAAVHVRARVHDWHWETGDLALDEASVGVDHPTISRRGSPETGKPPAVSFSRIALAAKSARFAIVDPLARVSMSASLVDARVHDASGLNALLPDTAAFALESEDGGFGAEIRIDVERHVAKGQVSAHAFRMGAGGKTLHLGGDVDLLADVANWDLQKSTLSLLDSRVTFRRVEGRFHAQGGADFSAERVAFEARAANFDLGRPTLRGSDFNLVVDAAKLPDARALAVLLPPGRGLGIESGAARASADVTVSDSKRAASGSVDVTLAKAAVRLGEARFSGDFHLHAGLRGFDPQEELLGLSAAHLEMRKVAVTGASATTRAWWGDATFSSASLRLAPDLQLDGVVALDARDARPFLAVIFGNAFPKILVGITDVPHLVGSTRLTVGANQLAVRDLHVAGGDVALRGSYGTSEGHRRGGLIAQKSFLSVGLRLDDDGTHLRLFGLNGWLRDQTRAVKELLDGRHARR